MSEWDNDQDYAHRKLVNRVIHSAFSNITDSIIDTHTAITVLAITVTAEVGGFIMLYFAKDQVNRSFAESGSNVWVYVALAVFAIGFLTIFALYRLMEKKWTLVGDRVFIWVISFCAGLLNVLLFFVLISFQMR